MFFSMLGLIWKVFLRRAKLFLNIILILYEPQIFWIFSDKSLSIEELMIVIWSSYLTILFLSKEAEAMFAE